MLIYSRRAGVAVLGLYLLLPLVFTYPLALHFATHVPGDGGDDPALVWNLWWVKYALLDLKRDPFHCDYMFYPIGINLAFYTLTILNGLISIPLQPLFGLVTSSNVILLLSFTLSGYGAYLLVRYLLIQGLPNLSAASSSRELAAFVAGLLYAFASNKLFYTSLGQFNIASSQWIPFYVLFLLKMGREPAKLRHPLSAALSLLLQAWAEMTFASFLLIFTFVYSVYYLALPRSDALPSINPALFLRGLFILGLIFLLGLSPILTAMIPDLLAEGDFFVAGSGFAEVFSADLVGFFVPTALHPLLSSLVERFDFPHDKAQHLYIGYAALALTFYAVIKLRRDTPVRFWAISAAIFSLLSLGPYLRVNGAPTALPLPFLILQRLPFFKGNRYPSRYGVMVMLCLAILVGYGSFDILGKIKQRRGRGPLISIFLISLIAFEHLSIPLPLSGLSVPDLYRMIAQEKGDFAVLEVPLAWRNGFRITGSIDKVIMFEQFYQTTHHQRILGGNTSRNPEFKFQYFTEAPVINSIVALETGHEIEGATLERDRALAPEVVRFFGFRYIVIHTQQAGPNVHEYLKAIFPLTKVYDQDNVVAYRVAPSPPRDEVTIDLGSDLAKPSGRGLSGRGLSLGEGWSDATDEERYVWAQRREARLFVPLSAAEQVMTVRAMAPGPGQKLTLSVNGRGLGSIPLGEGWGDYEIVIPARYVKAGLNELSFGFSRLFPLEGIRLGDYAVGRSGVTSPVDILVESAGMEVGDFGHIYVNGRNVSLEGRGYNVVVINPVTGVVEARGSFDTFSTEEESFRLADFIAAVPWGRVVAVAVRDEASLKLREEGVAALRGIGATGDLRGKFRWGQAVIGVKGALPGQALESVGLLRPVRVHVGQAVSEPHLAAAFDYIRFESLP